MKDKSKILQSTGKRKRALPEGNSPGISCSTGLVKERKGIANLSFYRPNQEQNALKKLIFILLIGPKNGGAYRTIEMKNEQIKKLGRAIKVMFLLFISIYSYGQGCSCISGTKDKEKGIETVGGLTNTSDYYSLLIQKVLNYKDTTVLAKYRLFLNAASRFLFSDSTLKALGIIELKLTDNTTIVLDSVEYKNNPLGICCTLGFWVYISEENIKILSENPIVSITVKDVLSSSFMPKRQIEQQKIYKCLLARKLK